MISKKIGAILTFAISASAFATTAGTVLVSKTSVNVANTSISCGQTSSISVTPKDTSGNTTTVGVSSVTFSVVTGGGTLSPPSVASGVYTTTFTPQTPGIVSIQPVINTTATPKSNNLASQTIAVSAGQPKSLTIVSGNNQNGIVGESLTSPLIVLVKDSCGNPLNGVTVTWGNGATSKTSTNGQAQYNYKLPTTSGQITLTTSVAGIANSANFTFNSDAFARIASRIVASSPNSIADGNSQDTITVNLVDNFGAPIVGQPVSLTATPSATFLSTPETVTSNISGVATFVVTSIVQGTINYQAKVNTEVSNDTATVTYSSPIRYQSPFLVAATGKQVNNNLIVPSNLSLKNYVFSASPSLPSGLNFDANADIVGNATMPAPFRTYTITATGDTTHPTYTTTVGIRIKPNAQIVVGDNFGCRLDASTGNIACYGANASQWFGPWNGTNYGYSTTNGVGLPPNIKAPSSTQGAGNLALMSGNYFDCAITNQNLISCWGSTMPTNVVETPNTIDFTSKKFQAMSTSLAQSCALDMSGQVYCWGSNLGPNVVALALPVNFQPGGVNATGNLSVAVGSGFVCILTKVGGVYCYGSTVGNNALVTTLPQALPATGNLVIAAGGDHACAITGNGNILCWGHNVQHKTDAPQISFNGQDSFVDLRIGMNDSCGITAQGKAVCWGALTTPPSTYLSQDVYNNIPYGYLTDGSEEQNILTNVVDMSFNKENAETACVIPSVSSSGVSSITCWHNGNLSTLGTNLGNALTY